MSIRMSVSDLETWRYWRDSEASTMDELLARLSHVEPATPAMEAGKAFARMMETLPVGEVDIHSIEIDGWTFDFTKVTGAMPLAKIRELKAEVQFETTSGPVTLVGKVDGLDGRIVHDQKLTERWDAERYFDSLQWRCYLVMFDAKAFTYDVVLCHRDEEAKHVEVTEYHPMTFCAYPSIRDDVQTAVNELAAVIAQHFPDLVTPDARALAA